MGEGRGGIGSHAKGPRTARPLRSCLQASRLDRSGGEGRQPPRPVRRFVYLRSVIFLLSDSPPMFSL